MAVINVIEHSAIKVDPERAVRRTFSQYYNGYKFFTISVLCIETCLSYLEFS